MPTNQEMLAKYMTAEAAILEGKEVRLGDRILRMEDLAAVRAGRQEWERKVSSEQAAAAGAPRIGGLTFSVASFRE
jgi:hypothetical protein